MRSEGYVARMGTRGMRIQGILVGKRPVGRSRCKWVDNIKADLREIGRDCVDWIYMAQDRDQWRALVNTVLNLWVP
jgi:hypothetical protein